MLALLIAVICVVALLAVLVVGLLRSHADILRALHELGAGVGDPATNGKTSNEFTETLNPFRQMANFGPPLPAERSDSAPDLVGVTPEGAAIAVSVNGAGRLTLLAFLSSGCTSCVRIWEAFADPAALELPREVRVVAVTKGPERESSAEVAAHARGRITTVMSSEAWSDYEVPGSPFFALVDGDSRRRIGEGVGGYPRQVADLVRRALADREMLARQAAGSFATMRTPASSEVGLNGPAREADNDRQLIDAGVLPGDESLYPTDLQHVFGPGRSDSET